jgi:HNH endonuclease
MTFDEVESEQWVGLVLAKGYDVSSLGRVRSYWKRGRCPKLQNDPHVLALYEDSLGYFSVRISVNHRSLNRKVHHLILEAFSGFRPEKSECRHLDGNPSNNHVENLTWGSRQENIADRTFHGTDARCGQRGDMHRDAKLCSETVRQIRKLRAEGHGIIELAIRFGVHNSVISRAATGRTWKQVEP